MSIFRIMDYFVPNETMRPLTIPQEMLLTNHPLIGYRCFNPTETTLLPNTVNLIDTGFTINFPPGYIIKLEPFSNSNPYKLLNHYIFPNQTKNNNLIIPLITTKPFITLPKNISLCYLRIISITDVASLKHFGKILKNPFFKITNTYMNLLLTIIFSFSSNVSTR